VGRLDRIFKMRLEAGANISGPPSSYLDRFWIDSITHSTHALAYLAQLIGPNRLVLGSDYPFDMGDPDPVGTVERTPGLDDDARAAILAGNVRALLADLA
jgi:aminocarboxymuconate-semialdehyde decarboxylase